LARLVASVLQRNETASETCWRVSRYFKKGKQHGRTYRFRRHSILFLHLGGGRRKGLETMLVLGRMAGQKITITVPPSDATREITLTVIRLSPLNVKLGIDAPQDVSIVRDDVLSTEPKPRIKPEWIARTPDDIN
jgi:sRNA-binding carbon storage regulator CsrA